MKISLKQWREVESAIAELKRATQSAEDRVFKLACFFPNESPEFKLLFALSNEIHEVRQAAPASYPYHPQSEWLGGCSDDPKNHSLREPNCCPAPRRKFTPEEVYEAGALCLGPVQWQFETPDITTCNGAEMAGYTQYTIACKKPEQPHLENPDLLYLIVKPGQDFTKPFTAFNHDLMVMQQINGPEFNFRDDPDAAAGE